MRNQEQQLAITHDKGPCMVLAGPGSGKTYTIVRRIENLIQNKQVRPEEILVITFTRAAAQEMKERFRDKMGSKGNLVTFGTFHGIYYGILKWAYKLQADSILSEEEKQQMLREILEKQQPEMVEEKEFLQDLLGEISLVKNHGIAVEEHMPKGCEKELFVAIYQEYERQRSRIRKLDFDDMLTETKRLFVERPDVLKLWQEKFRYLLIDEFQDINPVQYEVIRMLAEPENNLFVVGDDDQAIYRFRGARPELMLDFPNVFPDAKVLRLSKNYRSTKTIVEVSGKVISHNQKRYEKQLTTENEKGETVHIHESMNPMEESRYIMAEIQKRMQDKVPARKIAVLFRSAVDARILTETCMEYQLPFTMKDRMFNLYEHFIGKDLYAYLQLAKGERSRGHFLRIMNRPNRYISRSAVDKGKMNFEDLLTYYEEMDWMQERIEQFELDVKLMGRMAPYGAIQYLRKSVGYDLFLREYARFRNMRPEDLFDILHEIEERAKEYPTLDAWFEHIQEYTRLLQLQAAEKQNRQDGVQFMTMHGAKGLEFDTVFILGANEGVTPYKKAETKEEIEEERRMFYVAMTRAKRKLILTYTKEKNGKAMRPSRFIEEILEGVR